MAEDASQKPVQVKLVLLGTFPVLAVHTPQEQRPLCTQRPNAPCKGLTSFFSLHSGEAAVGKSSVVMRFVSRN